MIAKNITELIGNTPMIELKMKNNDWKVYLKLEKFNPGGSMKDRMALNMINQAYYGNSATGSWAPNDNCQ